MRFLHCSASVGRRQEGEPTFSSFHPDDQALMTAMMRMNESIVESESSCSGNESDTQKVKVFLDIGS